MEGIIAASGMPEKDFIGVPTPSPVPAVAAVLGIPDKIYGEEVAAYVVSK